MISKEQLSACSEETVIGGLGMRVSPVEIHIRKVCLSSSSIADQKNGPTVLDPSMPL